MCCKSKVKKTTTGAETTNIQVVQSTTNNAVKTSAFKGTSSNLPKSTISFSANDFDSRPLTNQQNFLITKKVVHNSEDRGDRLENYALENNMAKESRLLEPKQLLTYDLDKGDGVSKTPIINTFHYESQLNHCFLRQYNADQIQNRNSVYQTQNPNNYVTASSYAGDQRTTYGNQPQTVQGSYINPTTSRLERSGEGSFLKQERNSSFIQDQRYSNSGNQSRNYAVA